MDRWKDGIYTENGQIDEAVRTEENIDGRVVGEQRVRTAMTNVTPVYIQQ